MDEFGIIATYFASLAGPEGLGLMDDAALYRPPPEHDLIITKDTMVEGVHFPIGDFGAKTAQKLLRVNLSDLAAKAVQPVGYLLSLGVNETVSEDSISNFSSGLKTDQDEFGVRLFGGDTVRVPGPVVLSVTMIGVLPVGTMIKRCTANVGDDVWLTGTIGDAYLGLQCRLGLLKPSHSKWIEAYELPMPRVAMQGILTECATACADVSDGLIADCGNVAKASGVAAELQADLIPLLDRTNTWARGNQDRFKTLVTAGDDYELVFTAPPGNRKAIERDASQLDFPVTRIGSIISGEGVRCFDSKGKPLKFKTSGFTHLL